MEKNVHENCVKDNRALINMYTLTYIYLGFIKRLTKANSFK